MKFNEIHHGSCFELIKQLPDNTIDLVVTSPPYADTKSYGKKITVLHPDKYADWIIPLFIEMNRVIKPTGSIIFNIDDKCVKKLRHTFVFDLISNLAHHGVKLYDYYIWAKKVIHTQWEQEKIEPHNRMDISFCEGPRPS